MRPLTGLFFGSFNPIHIGHLAIAGSMLELTRMEEVWFVVSPQNPLKDPGSLLDNRERLRMVELAVSDNPRIKACDVEFGLPTPSYTCVTLAELCRRYPDRDFALIMGGDNLEIFPRWRNHEEILENFRIFVYPRPGHAPGELASHPNVEMVEVPMMDLSSTYIRTRIAQGCSSRYLVPDPVWRHIEEHGLYRS